MTELIGPCNSKIWPNGKLPYDRRLSPSDFVYASRGRYCKERDEYVLLSRRVGPAEYPLEDVDDDE